MTGDKNVYYWFKGAVKYWDGMFYDYNGPVEVDDNHYHFIRYGMVKLSDIHGDFYELSEALNNSDLAGKKLVVYDIIRKMERSGVSESELREKCFPDWWEDDLGQNLTFMCHIDFAIAREYGVNIVDLHNPEIEVLKLHEFEASPD